MIRRLIFLLSLVIASSAAAHEIRPAVLEIERTQADDCTITWRQPVVGNFAVRLTPAISDDWLAGEPANVVIGKTHRVLTWVRHDCSLEELERRSVSVTGLDMSITNVLLRIDYGNGTKSHRMLNPGDPPQSLGPEQKVSYGLASYLYLGVEHILIGIDHLAFVCALILLVGFRIRLIAVLTMFTVAHSITLCATALGYVAPSSALIEVLVALSIMFVALEILHVRRGRQTATGRWPELAAMGFGLLHGFAFANVLADIGLPEGEKLLALLLFNVGVEIGQIIFVAAALVLAWTTSKLSTRVAIEGHRLMPFAIGGAASYWFIDRVTQLFA